MGRRDFSAESIANLTLRALRAAKNRWRGIVYRALGMFADGTGTNLVFGLQPRFINTKAILLGQSVHYGLFVRLECYGGLSPEGQPRLLIGEGTSFGDYCHIGAINRVVIGRNVLGASGVLILDHTHGNPKEDIAHNITTDPKLRELTSRGEVVIGDNVWIGEGVIILAGSRIGSGAIIAARSVVRGEVLANSIHFGG